LGRGEKGISTHIRIRGGITNKPWGKGREAFKSSTQNQGVDEIKFSTKPRKGGGGGFVNLIFGARALLWEKKKNLIRPVGKYYNAPEERRVDASPLGEKKSPTPTSQAPFLIAGRKKENPFVNAWGEKKENPGEGGHSVRLLKKGKKGSDK